MLKKNEAVETETESDLPSEENGGSQQKTAGILLVLGSIARGILQIILMVAVLTGAFMGMNKLVTIGEKPPKRPSFKSVYTVETLKPEPGNFQPTMIVYGEIAASRSVDLRSLVSGEVTSVNEKLKAGARIAQGEALLEIDRFNYEGAVQEANANLAETQARIAENVARIKSEEAKLRSYRDQLVLAQRDLERIEALRKNGTATQKQVDDRELIVSQRDQSVSQTEINLEAENAKLAQQKAILERLTWRAQQAQRNLDDTILKAPFSGIISSSEVEVGKMVGANDVVVSIYQADKLDVRFTLTDQRFGRIQSDKQGLIGREVDVVWTVGSQEFVFPAVIDRIGARITSSRGGVEVFATIKNGMDAVSLRPGAFVEVRVPDKMYENHFRIPESSLYNATNVYVVVDGKLVEKAVTISGYDGEHALVSEGLEPGVEILQTRIAEISAGLAVQTEEQASQRAKNRSGGREAATAFRELSDEEKEKAIAAILKQNDLTMEEWEAMSPPEKGPLIGAYMRDKAAKAKP